MPRLSIVMQGPVTLSDGNIDPQAIENILLAHRYYPEAEIVVSTWQLPVEVQDTLKGMLSRIRVRWVWSRDPGALRAQIYNQQVISNVNRLRVSAWEGIQASSGEFVAKLRTDCRLKNNNLLALLDRFFTGEPPLVQEGEFRVFSQHVINANLYARSPRGTRPFLYHPGDIFLMGRRADVLAFFAAPAATNALMDPYGRRQPFSLMRRVPEQYFWMHCIMQQQKRYLCDADLIQTPSNRQRSDRYYVSNFYPLSPEELGFDWLKLDKEYRWKDRWLSIYLPAEWQQLYQLHVLGTRARFSGMLLFRQAAITGLSIAFRARDLLLRRPIILRLVFRLFARNRRQPGRKMP